MASCVELHARRHEQTRDEDCIDNSTSFLRMIWNEKEKTNASLLASFCILLVYLIPQKWVGQTE